MTSKEFALLELFLLHADDLVTRTEILAHVWDSQFDGCGSNLVDVYINRLRQKVDQNGFKADSHGTWSGLPLGYAGTTKPETKHLYAFLPFSRRF